MLYDPCPCEVLSVPHHLHRSSIATTAPAIPWDDIEQQVTEAVESAKAAATEAAESAADALAAIDWEELSQKAGEHTVYGLHYTLASRTLPCCQPHLSTLSPPHGLSPVDAAQAALAAAMEAAEMAVDWISSLDWEAILQECIEQVRRTTRRAPTLGQTYIMGALVLV